MHVVDPETLKIEVWHLLMYCHCFIINVIDSSDRTAVIAEIENILFVIVSHLTINGRINLGLNTVNLVRQSVCQSVSRKGHVF